ncbi:hypothetical protein ACFW4X_14005 [Streptomyces smyrnaeus]|uniref:hypothetical protein n=1 Tax=Streptomyces smyrnaeus TaxID=1387713 RepID=UPI003693FF77
MLRIANRVAVVAAAMGAMLTSGAMVSTAESASAAQRSHIGVQSRAGYFLGDGINIRNAPNGPIILGKGYRGETFTAHCWNGNGLWIYLTAHRGNVTGWVSVSWVFYTNNGPMGYC